MAASLFYGICLKALSKKFKHTNFDLLRLNAWLFLFYILVAHFYRHNVSTTEAALKTYLFVPAWALAV